MTAIALNTIPEHVIVWSVLILVAAYMIRENLQSRDKKSELCT